MVDTGADETLFPISIARALGVELDQQLTSEAAGISGARLTIHYGDVELRIENAGETIAWKTTEGFVDFGSTNDEVIILGHGGCLDYFTTTFDGEQAELAIEANALPPA